MESNLRRWNARRDEVVAENSAGAGIPILKVLISKARKLSRETSCWSILCRMAANLKEMAQKMAQAARAGVAIEKKRLQEILAERQKKSKSPQQ